VYDIDSHTFMKRSHFERVNSHWVRAFFNEDEWAGTLKEAKITGVWFHKTYKYYPLRNESEVKHDSPQINIQLRRESEERNAALPVKALRRKPFRRKRLRPLDGRWFDLNTIKSAVAKYATFSASPVWPADSPSPPRVPTKRLEPVSFYCPPVIEAVPEPNLVTETKALINKKYEEMLSTAMTRQEIADAWEWCHRMYDAVDVLIKTGRVHEFITKQGDNECKKEHQIK